VLEIGCDLIILDFSMPGLDGVQVATKLREQKVETPIILITGFRAPEIYERLGSISNVAILQKPFGLTELYKCIGALTPCAQLQKRD
jgi:DNA-binding response OmpR family regulator